MKVSAFFCFRKTRARALFHLLGLTDGLVQFFGNFDAGAGEQVGHVIPVFSGTADGGDIDGYANEFRLASLEYLGAVSTVVSRQRLDLSHHLMEVPKDGDSIARDHCKSVVFSFHKKLFKSC